MALSLRKYTRALLDSLRKGFQEQHYQKLRNFRLKIGSSVRASNNAKPLCTPEYEICLDATGRPISYAITLIKISKLHLINLQLKEVWFWKNWGSPPYLNRICAAKSLISKLTLVSNIPPPQANKRAMQQP